jgi:AraC-like DNA-binding protein
MLCVRDVRVPWHFTYGNSTRARALHVPRSALAAALGTCLPQVTLVRQDAPEARLLDGHLDLVWTLAESLPAASLPAARDAVLSLVSGVIAARGAPAADAPAQSVRRAAQKYANEHLRDPGLGPPSIAGALGISVRTLHRTFADSGESLMAYIRRRRLECARAELMLPGRSRSISDVAARWQFSDASHFIRSFRGRYGETPGSVSVAFWPVTTAGR